MGEEFSKNNKHKKKPGPICIDRLLLHSTAVKSLTGQSFFVLMLFMARRQFHHIAIGNGKRKVWIIKNNGKIIFPYREAIAKGIKKTTFTRCLDDLMDKGLLDITHQGNGLLGDYSTYGLSERWQHFGTDKFEMKTRQKDIRFGFRKKKK